MAPYITSDYQKHFDDGYDQPTTLLELRQDAPELFPEPASITEIAESCAMTYRCNQLAEVIVYEARGESTIGKYAVASVVLNRVDSPRFPNTIREVVHQKFQFSYLGDMHMQKPPTRKDWIDAQIVAYNLLFGNKEVVTDSTHYLNPDAVSRIPRWAKVYEHRASIGNHQFYRYR